MAEKKTIWQSLNIVLNSEANPMSLEPKNNVSAFGQESENSNGLITANSKEELDVKKKEYQQDKFLTGQGKVVSNDRYQLSVFYETTRYASYIDFEAMEYFPEIAAALDIMSEESTCLHDNGKMLDIRSNSERIKNILEHLFYSILNINANLPAWVRNVCKYGDNFIYIESKQGRGITACEQLTNIEVKRVEGNIFKKDEKRKTTFEWKKGNLEFQNFQVAHFRLIGDDKKLPYGTSVLEKARKIWKMLSLAEDAMMVYRLSRAPERRVFKIDVGNIDDKDVENYVQKIAAKFKKTTQVNQSNGQIDLRYNVLSQDEDYFIPTRNGQNGTVIDTLAGACLSLSTKIPLLDGRTLELKEIISKWDSGERDFWCYSINPKTGEIVPGLVTWAGETRKNTDVIKITLDNNEEIILTPDHKVPTKFNGLKEAKDLLIGESLWSFNKDFKKIRYSKSKYETVYDHSIKKDIYTHRLVANYMKKLKLHNEWYFSEEYKKANKETIHHKDINRYNNNPENLIFMNSHDHILYHTQNIVDYHLLGGEAYKIKYETNDIFYNEVNEHLKNCRKNYYNNRTEEKEIEHNEAISNGNKLFFSKLSKEQKVIFLLEKGFLGEEAQKKGKISFEKNFNSPEERQIFFDECGRKSSITKNKPENLKRYSENGKKIWKIPGYKESVIEKQTIKYSDNLLKIFKETVNIYYKRKLVLEKLNENLEFINEFRLLNKNIKRKDFTNNFENQHINKMLSFYGYKDYKHFRNDLSLFNHTIIKIEFLTEKIDTGTLTIDGNEIYHNYHNFALASGVFINNSNLDAISDISFLQNKLFAALRVPKTFLGFAEATGDGKNLAMQDVRFARTINKIQQAMLMELNKIAIIHLHLLGFTEDWNNFTLALANPSSQAEMLKLEILGIKLDTYIKAVADAGNGWGAMSMTKAKKEILNMSEDEIVLDLQQQRLEKAEALRNSPEVLATKQLNSGMFDNLDKRYKDNGESTNNTMENPNGPEGGAPGGAMPGGGGLPPMPPGPDGENPEGGVPELGPDGAPLPAMPGSGAASPEEPTTIKENMNFIDRNHLIKENIQKSLDNVDKIIKN